MNETCKTCKKVFDLGICMSPQFNDEKVLLFCSEKCRLEYLKYKLQHIKSSYPKYYDKLVNSSDKNYFSDAIEKKNLTGKKDKHKVSASVPVKLLGGKRR